MLLGQLLSVAWAADRVRLVRPPRSWTNIRICDLTEDSRTVVPGSLFVARAGEEHDGARFLDQAVASGAVAVLVSSEAIVTHAEVINSFDASVAVLVADDPAREAAHLAERFYGRPTDRLAVVGVTGTNGKSTVAHIAQQLLARRKSPCGLIGTIEIDDGTERAPATLTTPPAIELSRTFAVMVDSGCTTAAMEVSSHALAQGRVDAVRFSAGVFTNLGTDHVDYHGSQRAYLDAKLGLFRMLGPDGPAIVNIDDPHAEAVIATARGPVIRCSLRADPGPGSGVDASASIASADASGSEVRLRGPWGELTARTPLLGEHNAMNLLQALGAAWAIRTAPAIGVGGRAGATRIDRDAVLAELADALGRVTAPPGRLEPVHQPGDEVAVIVDYAHTPDAYELTMSALRAVMPEDAALTVVFGCGGDREPGKRPKMGKAAVSGSDRVVVTSDNPRRERPGAIVNDILSGMTTEEKRRVEVHIDREAAVRHAIQSAKPGDVVLLLGKGHETYQMVADPRGGAQAPVVAVPYNERAFAAAVLAERRRGARAGRDDSGGHGGDGSSAGHGAAGPGVPGVVVRPSAAVGP